MSKLPGQCQNFKELEQGLQASIKNLEQKEDDLHDEFYQVTYPSILCPRDRQLKNFNSQSAQITHCQKF